MVEVMEFVLKKIGTPKILYATFKTAIRNIQIFWFHKIAALLTNNISTHTLYTIKPYQNTTLLNLYEFRKAFKNDQINLTNLLQEKPLKRQNGQTPFGTTRIKRGDT